MFELRGKYNTAKVFTDNCDNETISQLTTLLNQEFCKDSQIRIMPDCHAGKGCVIGTTMTLSDKVVVNLVGVDISCGMLCIQLEETKFDPQKLDQIIQNYVPSGCNVHDEEHPELCRDVENLIAPVNKSLAYRSIGSLGGGNHFLEVDKDKNGRLYLVIHSGSRHLGLEVANHYQELAYKNHTGLSKDEREALIESLKRDGRAKEIQKTIEEMKNKYHVEIPKDLYYIQGSDMANYIHDMKIMNKFATANRHRMADIIISRMGWHVTDQFTTTHNYVDTDNMILRKGSISAQKNEKVIIPMNMRDGSLICIGKGNPDWNYSAPHGAGRIISRSQAKDLVDMQEFEESMNGIYSSSVCTSTIDEAPMVYKPMTEIMENIKDTVDIIDVIRPVYNFKAH